MKFDGFRKLYLSHGLTQVESPWWFVSLRNPAIICMPLSFCVAIVVSLMTTETNADATFAAMQARILFGRAQPATVQE